MVAEILSFDVKSIGKVVAAMSALSRTSNPSPVVIPCHARMEEHSGIRAGDPNFQEILAYRCDQRWFMRSYDPGDLPERGKPLRPYDVVWAVPLDVGSAHLPVGEIAGILTDQAR